MPETIPTGDIGLQAALRYARLTWHALSRPVLAHLPTIGLGTRLYLLFNTVLYAVAAAAFLTPIRGIHIGHTGLGAVDPPVLHALWGLGALVVCLSQIAALVNDRWTVWQVCAVGTAVWASAWAVVTIAMAHLVGNYGGAAVWLWIVGMHFLFITNQLTPHRASSSATHTAEDERALIRDIERAVSEPPPTPPQRTSSRKASSDSSPHA